MILCYPLKWARKKKYKKQKHDGFTLIELLLSIAIISAIAGIVIVALSPRRQFISATDAMRQSDAREIQQAIYQNLIDNWELPGDNKIQEGQGQAKPICRDTVTEENCPAGSIPLNALVPDYIAQIPVDPAEPENSPCTGYSAYTDAGRPRALSLHLGKLTGDVIGASCELGTVCPNGNCESGEECAADCSTETHCSDGVDNDGDGFADLNDNDCPGGVTDCPAPNGDVNAIVALGSTIYFGGEFTSVGGETRNYLAAVDENCNLTNWNPNADNKVNALVSDGTKIYAGGAFQNIGGAPRLRLAAIDTNGVVDANWDPDPNGEVHALAYRDEGSTMIYAGGSFTQAGGKPRANLVKINPGGVETGWKSDANAPVHAIAIYDNTVYVGGEFTEIDGDDRNYVAVIALSNGRAQAWNPNASGMVYTLAVSGDGQTTYLGGEFQQMSGQSRNRLAAVDASGNLNGSWNPNANDVARALLYSSENIYIGGRFQTIKGTERNRIAIVDSNNTLNMTWDPNAEDEVRAIVINGSYIYLGGKFNNLDGDTSKAKFAKVASP